MVKLKFNKRIDYKKKTYGRGSIVEVPEEDMYKFAQALAWDSVRIIKDDVVKVNDLSVVKSKKKTKGRKQTW